MELTDTHTWRMRDYLPQKPPVLDADDKTAWNVSPSDAYNPFEWSVKGNARVGDLVAEHKALATEEGFFFVLARCILVDFSDIRLDRWQDFDSVDSKKFGEICYALDLERCVERARFLPEIDTVTLNRLTRMKIGNDDVVAHSLIYRRVQPYFGEDLYSGEQELLAKLMALHSLLQRRVEREMLGQRTER